MQIFIEKHKNYGTEQELQTTDKAVKRRHKAKDFSKIERTNEESYYLCSNFIEYEGILEKYRERIKHRCADLMKNRIIRYMPDYPISSSLSLRPRSPLAEISTPSFMVILPLL